MSESMHSDIRKALAEPDSVRPWALACAVAMVFVGDSEADVIFAKLTGPERMLLGRCIARAAFQATEAQTKAAPPQTPLSDKWQDIASAPRDELLLLWWPTIPHPEQPGVRMHRSPIVGCVNAVRGRKPTHWRPLPAPPLSNDKGAGA